MLPYRVPRAQCFLCVAGRLNTSTAEVITAYTRGRKEGPSRSQLSPRRQKEENSHPKSYQEAQELDNRKTTESPTHQPRLRAAPELGVERQQANDDRLQVSLHVGHVSLRQHTRRANSKRHGAISRRPFPDCTYQICFKRAGQSPEYSNQPTLASWHSKDKTMAATQLSQHQLTTQKHRNPQISSPHLPISPFTSHRAPVCTLKTFTVMSHSKIPRPSWP